MRCTRCDANINDEMEICRFCGQDLSIIYHVRRISNAYYNMGLEKAQVRDLSGAIMVLKKSLQFDKYNTNARNLLGLVYNEMGETVAALSEWVLSRYLQPENNRAQYYINVIQKNQTALDAVNQTIKKYNSALNAAKGGNEDLAVIQLKKVVSLNPKFVRALQLLALLYMKSKEYSKAAKCLKRARRIDYNNTTTLRYMQEIGDKFSENEGKSRENSARAYRQQPKKDPLANVQPVGAYKEEKRHWMPVINVIIGVIIGLVVSFVLIRPTLLGNNLGNNSDSIAENNQQLSVKEAQLSSVQKQKEKLEQDVAKLQKKLDEGEDANTAKLELSNNLLLAVKYYNDGDKLLAASTVSQYKESDFEKEEMKELFKMVSKKITQADVKNLFEQGRAEFNRGKYDDAEKLLKQVLSVDAENLDALYFMGRVYHQRGKKKKAIEYYEKVIEIDEASSRAAEARSRLRQLGVS